MLIASGTEMFWRVSLKFQLFMKHRVSIVIGLIGISIRGFAGGLDGRRAPARVMPKMVAALWRRMDIGRMDIRRNDKS